MAFTVQNAAGTAAGANALITVAEVTAYLTDRGTLPSPAPTDTVMQQSIIEATDFLNNFEFIGRPLAANQSTPWPRRYPPPQKDRAYNISVEYVQNTPQDVKNAVIELTLVAITGTLQPNLTYEAGGREVTDRTLRVGELSIQQRFKDAFTTLRSYPSADKWLSPYLFSFNGIRKG